MKCPNCGKKMNDNTVFCTHCGSKLQTAPIVSSQNEQVTKQPDKIKKQPQKGSGKAGVIILTALVVLLAGALGVGGYFFADLKNKNSELQESVEESEEKYDELKEENDDIRKELDELKKQLKEAEDNRVEREEEPPAVIEDEDNNVIKVYSYTDEFPEMVQRYLDTHPECGYTMSSTVISTIDGAYQPALDMALQMGGNDAPDIYMAEEAFVYKYTKGDMSEYAMPYEKLGIDVDYMMEEADIAGFTAGIGSNPNGEVVGLSYQSDSGAFIYRRSIAKAIWGTDDPKVIATKIGAGTGSWDTFMKAAAEAKSKGYVMVSSIYDIWNVVECSGNQSWVEDGVLKISPEREEFIDLAYELVSKGYTNRTNAWSDEWFNDMESDSNVLGYFGPCWLIEYTLEPNSEDTMGDWAITTPPIGYSWGGSWVLANANCSKSKYDVIKDILEWATLDSSEEGLQYMWANGEYSYGYKQCVPSGKVMSYTDGTLEFLGGQDMFDVFIETNQMALTIPMSEYDEVIAGYFQSSVYDYIDGYITKDEVIDEFKSYVYDCLDVVVD